MPTIRYATSMDAAALAALAEQTFRDAFAELNTPENMNLHCAANYSASIQGQEINNSNMATLVCEVDNTLIAFAQMRWSDAPPCVMAKKAGEIQRFYVEKNWHGKSIAQAMMNRCFEHLKANQADAAWLGVFEINAKAIAFYQKCGFEKVGEHVFVLGRDPQRDVLMARRL